MPAAVPGAGLDRTTCLACGSADLRQHARSRATGRAVVECRSCGLRALAEFPDHAEMAELTEHDLDEFAAWAALSRGESIDRTHREVLDHLGTLAGAPAGRRIFDVGAGAGNFLAAARGLGYEASGNDLAPGAVRLVKERHDLDLHLGDLADLGLPAEQDVVTMWCVLAHVTDGPRLLAGAAHLLKPGGVMYLQTPRWSWMDAISQKIADLTRGRVTRVLDRRMAEHHMVLHSQASLDASMRRAGLEPVSIDAAARYSLETSAYLLSMRIPRRIAMPLSRLIDLFVARGLVPKNVWDAYARRVDA